MVVNIEIINREVPNNLTKVIKYKEVVRVVGISSRMFWREEIATNIPAFFWGLVRTRVLVFS